MNRRPPYFNIIAEVVDNYHGTDEEDGNTDGIENDDSEKGDDEDYGDNDNDDDDLEVVTIMIMMM